MLTDIIRLHHASEHLDGQGETHRALRATFAANLASKAMGYGFTSETMWDTVTINPVWEQLIRYDLRHHSYTEHLIEEIKNLQQYLDEYVGTMLA